MADHASLSARALEILRRADAQIDAIKAPAPAPRELPEAPPGFGPAAPADDRPPELQDLGQLLDTVQAGVDAARAHLVTLSASLERIAEELDAAEPAPMVLPPALEGHAKLPSELARAAAEVEAASGAEPPGEPVAPKAGSPAMSAAHEAARLVAIEMAVAGDTREGVGRRLRNEFGIRDPASILDDAFGPNPGGTGRRTYGV